MITCTKDEDGALMVTIDGSAEMAPVRERVLLMVLDAQQGARLAAQSAPVNVDAEPAAPASLARFKRHGRKAKGPAKTFGKPKEAKSDSTSRYRAEVLEALKTHSPCSPPALFRAMGYVPRQRLRDVLAEMAAEGLVQVTGTTKTRTVTLVEG